MYRPYFQNCAVQNGPLDLGSGRQINVALSLVEVGGEDRRKTDKSPSSVLSRRDLTRVR